MTDNVKAAEAAPRVPKRVAAVIINSLKGGVVPRIGLPYITVGREAEIRALLTDLSLISDGGASFRFLVGRYGSGKSFLLQTIRTHAMGEGFVVADADLSPERRLQGGQGQGLATYRELMRNLSTKTRPEGGALMLILDRWISNLQMQVAGELGAGADAPGGAAAPGGAPVSNDAAATGGAPNDPAFNQAVEARIREQVASLEEMVHGFDFARLLILYYRAVVDGDDELKGNVARWFRGEYRTKTEARQELGVSIIIGDDDWYDYVKLFAQFLKGAGYQGMLVLIDELVNLYKIPTNITTRRSSRCITTPCRAKRITWASLWEERHRASRTAGAASLATRRCAPGSRKDASPRRACAICWRPSSICTRSPMKSCSFSSKSCNRSTPATLGMRRA